jgi:hypothetical protein
MLQRKVVLIIFIRAVSVGPLSPDYELSLALYASRERISPSSVRRFSPASDRDRDFW